MKFELLREEEVIGENRLDIFKKISSVASATDVVSSQLMNANSKECPYWLNSYQLYYTERKPWEFGKDSNIEAKYVEKSNFFTNSSKLDNGQVGVRLKVAFDEIKDEIIKEELSDRPYVVQVENGVKVLLALEWPQEFITEKQDRNNLNILDKYGQLKKSERKYHITINEERPGMYYKDNVYVKIGDNWAKISPIEWYYDEDTNVLISKKVLFLCPMANFSGYYTQKFDIEKSIISSFIYDKFENEAIMDSTVKDCYFLPFSVNDYESYSDELREIFFWETYNEKRKWRKSSLERLKLVTSEDGLGELSQIIDDILKLNSEDEKFIEQFVEPKYIVNRANN